MGLKLGLLNSGDDVSIISQESTKKTNNNNKKKKKKKNQTKRNNFTRLPGSQLAPTRRFHSIYRRWNLISSKSECRADHTTGSEEQV